MRLTRRLYLQVYAALLATVLLFVAVSAAAWLAGARTRHDAHLLRGLAAMVSDLLPPGRPEVETEASVGRLERRVGLAMALYTPEGRLLAGSGGELPAPRASWQGSRWVPGGRAAGPALALRLDDGRWLVAGQRSRGRHGVGALFAFLLLAGVAAAGAYPVARRITRRLERLQRRVDALGRGDLAARVEIEGKDEVADLARSFNAAAERIEGLVASQRGMLARASHELRSPLARIRMAAELLGENAPPEARRQLERDVDELDELVTELLLASRLQAQPRPGRVEPVDLLALVAEECASASASAEATGVPLMVSGDPRMLRRMVRNLLENARRHAAGSPVEASVTPADGEAVVRVEDRGPGVPEPERERIFEPFYRPAGWREGPEGGVGLGLSLVRQIARHHGGDARCLARAGGGSCFEVRLPLS